MSLRKVPILVVAALFSLLLNAYLFLQTLMVEGDSKAQKLSMGDECKNAPDSQVSAKTNPNKMLFISCGGFLE
jgi:hypothetical protein